MDGTHVLRPDGTSKETYDIVDILSYARAWTGKVEGQSPRPCVLLRLYLTLQHQVLSVPRVTEEVYLWVRDSGTIR